MSPAPKPATVVSVTGRDDNGATGTFYVSTEGKPYVLKALTETDTLDETTFSTDYDKPIPSATPSADESVDASQLNELLGQRATR